MLGGTQVAGAGHRGRPVTPSNFMIQTFPWVYPVKEPQQRPDADPTKTAPNGSIAMSDDLADCP